MAALVDAVGRLLRFVLLSGRRHESLAVSGLSFGALLAALGAEAVVSPKSNRREAIDCDMEKYRKRYRVKNLFCRTKRFHRIATRYDPTESSCAAMHPSRRHLDRAGIIVNALQLHEAGSERYRARAAHRRAPRPSDHIGACTLSGGFVVIESETHPR